MEGWSGIWFQAHSGKNRFKANNLIDAIFGFLAAFNNNAFYVVEYQDGSHHSTWDLDLVTHTQYYRKFDRKDAEKFLAHHQPRE